MSNITIRFADLDDLSFVANLYISNHKKTYTGLLSDAYISSLSPQYGLKKWTEYFNDPYKKIWVSYENDTFLGFVAGMEDLQLPHTWYLDSLHVAESARGKGVGTSLIKTIGKYAFVQQYDKMSVCIVRGNNTAGDLYKKLGAVHVSFFTDEFGGTVSQSEKLLWENLKIFQP